MSALRTLPPPTKAVRQRAILDLVRTRPIHTQGELVTALREHNHVATQATVSRDIRELGLTRVAGAGGNRYAVRSGLGSRALQALRDFVVSVEGVQFIAVIHTPPGTANLVAYALDEAAWPEVAGTVAGDDTVMVTCRSAADRARFEKKLNGAGGAEEA